MSVSENRSLVQVVYVSDTSGKLPEAELMSIVYSARRWNEKYNITGALFCKNGVFG